MGYVTNNHVDSAQNHCYLLSNVVDYVEDTSASTNKLSKKIAGSGFCDIYKSSPQIYTKLELSEFDTQTYDLHNVPELNEKYLKLPINVNIMDASIHTHNKMYTGCPSGFSLRLVSENPIDIRCLEFGFDNFPAEVFDNWWITNTNQGALQKW